MKDEVADAIKELEAGAPGTGVRWKEDDSGGAYVIVDGIDVGTSFSPATAWIGFHVTWACRDADVYPHFIAPEVTYVGNGDAPNQHPEGNLPTSMTRGATMPGFELPAIQISRRSNRRDAETDSPLQKLLRIVQFLRTR